MTEDLSAAEGHLGPRGLGPAALAEHLDRIFAGSAWHGPALYPALKALGPRSAAYTPDHGRPSAWHIALHCAYWKHRVRQRITGKRYRFPRSGLNFPPPPAQPSSEAWHDDLQLLVDTHRELVGAVRSLSVDELARAGPRQKRPRVEHVMGIAFHDAYHAGQVRLLTKLSPIRDLPTRDGPIP